MFSRLATANIPAALSLVLMLQHAILVNFISLSEMDLKMTFLKFVLVITGFH